MTTTIPRSSAEVTTVKVGGRYLTKEMIYQLDFVPDDMIEPIGRVAYGSRRHVTVIGTHVADGSLVRAQRRIMEPIDVSLERRLTELGAGEFSQFKAADFRGVASRSEVDEFLRHCRDDGRVAIDGYITGEARLMSDDELDDARRGYLKYRSLPLIVLG